MLITFIIALLRSLSAHLQLEASRNPGAGKGTTENREGKETLKSGPPAWSEIQLMNAVADLGAGET